MEIKTEGIKYTGSKKLLLPNIIKTIKNYDIKTTLDGFAGTTRVGQSLKQFGYSVDSNDISDYSQVFGNCYLVNNQIPTDLEEKIKYLNSLKGYSGWFTQNYGGLSDENGNIISSDNKKKI